MVLLMRALAKRGIASAQQEDERQSGGGGRYPRHDSAPFDLLEVPSLAPRLRGSRF
jgi:hypothetical protein